MKQCIKLLQFLVLLFQMGLDYVFGGNSIKEIHTHEKPIDMIGKEKYIFDWRTY